LPTEKYPVIENCIRSNAKFAQDSLEDN
jgi:hypothetical protein